ncbi:NTPase KAP, partial [Vibrio cholerae]|nr:NTPase KAP [Vibrio cholerae]
ELSKTNINMKIKTHDQFEYFLESERVRHHNLWPTGYYSCTILEYVRKIITIILSKDNTNSIVSSATREAFNIQRSGSIKTTRADIWVSIEFANMQQKNGQSLDFYKNLVDLSSALDSVEIKETD